MSKGKDDTVWLTQREFSLRHNIKSPALRDRTLKGQFGDGVRQTATGRFEYNPAVCDPIMDATKSARTNIQRIHAAYNGRSPDSSDGGSGVSLATDTERYLKAQADEKEQLATLAQIKVDQQRGVLVEREKVNKQVFRLMRMVRDGMLNVPSKVAPEIAAMDEPFAIQKRLEAEFRQVLEDMATSAANLADEPDDE